MIINNYADAKTRKFFIRFPFSSRLIFIVCFPIIVLFLIAYSYLLKSLPVSEGIVKINGALDEIVISRGSYSIPRIKASNDLDAYFALGFTHAQERLWQMEMGRRIGEGRLSELLGKRAISSDIFMRTLGLYKNAKEMLENLSDSERTLLDAYVNGVNEGIRKTDVFPIEFLTLMYEPDAWTAEDSLLLMQMMTWRLSGNFGLELQRTLLIQTLGLEKANQLMGPIELDLEFLNDSQSEPVVDFSKLLGTAEPEQYSPHTFVGSNSWVVSGKHTASRLPLLANDPHLSNSIPSVWYLAGLKGKTLNSFGATFPGLPFVVIGGNSDISWGLTNMLADTQDVYLEKINPLNSEQYELDGRYLDMEITESTINIKSDFLRREEKPLIIKIRRTHRGPILSDVSNQLKDYAYSIRWTGDDQKGGTFKSFVKINYSKNWNEFNSALETYVAPIHNFVYADTKGNIGFVAPGLLPIRSKGNGSVPLPGWLSKNDWQGWVPFESMPRDFNPKKGYIITANNKVVGEDYPFHITSDWAPSYRAKRIESALEHLIDETNGKLTVDHMKSLQGDILSPFFSTLMPALKQLEPNSPRQTALFELLRSWDGQMKFDSAAALLYSSWMSHLNRLLIEDDISRTGLKGVAGHNVGKLLNSSNEPFLAGVLNKKSKSFCDYLDTGHKEDCRELILLALDHADNELSNEYGSNHLDWRWDDAHVSHYPHFPFSENKYSTNMPSIKDDALTRLLHPLLHREVSSQGGANTINSAPSSFHKDLKYLQFYSPSYRQVINMNDSSKGSYILNTGQSGNPLSEHYDDLVDKHRGLEYITIGDVDSGTQVMLLPVINEEKK